MLLGRALRIVLIWSVVAVLLVVLAVPISALFAGAGWQVALAILIVVVFPLSMVRAAVTLTVDIVRGRYVNPGRSPDRGDTA